MNHPLRIALIVPPVSWYDRVLIDGIAAYGHEHGPWRFVLQTDTERNRIEPWVRRWKPDAVLARITGPRMAATLLRLAVPVIDLLEESGESGIPRVVCDDRELVYRAVDHLLDRHLPHVAYVGRRDMWFGQQRRELFREYVGKRQRAEHSAGGPILSCQDVLLKWESMPHLHAELAEWLRSLPKPVGVVACNDAWGALVLRACNEYDLNVPDEVAVIGIDDDPMICNMCTPTLSSIGVNARAIGYRAAAMLHGMITRGTSPPPVTLVEPGPVRSRASTDTLAIPEKSVVAALRYLRAHACERITVQKVSAQLGVSRRTLERSFTAHVGHSPAVEIMRARLERTKDLLISTELALADVARQAGFFHVETLHRLFKKEVGVTLGEYRRIHGLHR